jgi:flagellar motor switch/type III secretory pathway protein FliN
MSPGSQQDAAATTQRPEEAQQPAVPGAGTALLARGEIAADAPDEGGRDMRLDQMPMQLDVLVRVRSFRVGDLLALSKGTVVETVHDHAADVPLACGGALLVWGEFEVVEQKLGVRITRLA